MTKTTQAKQLLNMLANMELDGTEYLRILNLNTSYMAYSWKTVAWVLTDGSRVVRDEITKGFYEGEMIA